MGKSSATATKYATIHMMTAIIIARFQLRPYNPFNANNQDIPQLRLIVAHDQTDNKQSSKRPAPTTPVMKAFPMFVLPLNNLVTMKIITVEITRPITKITAGYAATSY
ncbi:hypothetical protein BH18THE1_BH18THE1_04320 [soil metagenome]